MKIRQIEIFRSVMAGGSTIAAATALGLSQSAVSRQLTQLEEELGFELFERSKGRLLPRPEAFALMDEVGELASLVARLKRYTEDLRAGTVGQRFLKVAVPHSFIATVMPERSTRSAPRSCAPSQTGSAASCRAAEAERQ